MKTEPAYVNVHGQPISVSARDAVTAIEPAALCTRMDLGTEPMWVVYRTSHRSAARIGTGANEEAAWRDAWSRILAKEVAKEAPR